ncbi:MAG: hypothetical protein PHH54_01245 [Candidatus Nanoarchaeia archaeon]|nr:hypothetical protein [Candidatus Nanoarchaeia archaeon]MDD5740588.1 hypothetical protein [Candidatus Nanoarchaeia archaeon]
MARRKDYRKIEQKLRKSCPKVKLNGEYYTRAQIYDCLNLKRILVNENPELAHQLYLQWEDKELGTIFANTYNGHLDYGEQAYHIASELGILGVKPPFSKVRADVDAFEERIFNKNTSHFVHDLN